MRVKDAVGRFGEDVAARVLTEAGLHIIERNWRCPEGELDIVACAGAELVVVEVKTRSSALFGAPVEAVGRAKAARLRRLAARWMTEHRDEPDLPRWSSVRFDVIGVLRGPGGVEVDHVVGALG